MRTIRIENLRSLVDTDDVRLSPITLLLGQNSSGKSTFLRLFPLLRQSVEVPTVGPILWFGRFVDFGSFQEAINKNSSKKEINLQFDFSLPRDGEQFMVSQPSRLEDMDVTVKLSMAPGTKVEETYVKALGLKIGEHVVDIQFTPDGKVEQFLINGRDCLKGSEKLSFIQKSGLIPSLIEEVQYDRNTQAHVILTRVGGHAYRKIIIEKVRKLVHANTRDETIHALAESFSIGSSSAMLEQMSGSTYGTDSWRRNVSNWTVYSEEFCSIRDLVIAKLLPEILDLSNNYLTRYANNVNYIAPLRATAERYYRLQGLAVGEVDYQGQNMAMFLQNMSQNDRNNFNNFTKWMYANFGFAPQINVEGGHISIKIGESNVKEQSYNLADMGFGFSQILPIVTQLWVLTNRRPTSRRTVKTPITFAIEQPELHLHPRLQAKLADAFISAVNTAKKQNLDLRLLVETHSETIVNRLGHQIANKKISNEDVSIILFEKPSPEKPTKVSFGKYDEEGFLINWPYGFFEME